MKHIRYFVAGTLVWGCSAADERDKPTRAERDRETDVAGGDDGTTPSDGDPSAGYDDPGDDEPDGGGDAGDDDDETPPATDEDAAEVVWADLPTDLECGGSYLASIEMRNTGTATWTRDAGYKLGGVDDSDALYGPEARVWLAEGVAIAPGQTHIFELELAAPVVADDYVTDWQMVHENVWWFGEATVETVAVNCGVTTFCDSLTDATLQAGFADKRVEGGSFSAAGWQTTDDDDQLLAQLTAPIWGDGTLEVDVTNFDPASQYAGNKHQIINMYTSNNGSQDVFETTEAWWNIRTGTNYGTGFKFLAAPQGGDSREEGRFIESASWDRDDTHTFKATWDAEVIDIYLDDTHLGTFAFDGRIQPLQHIFIGKDNVYAGQVGPIYSNLCVTY